jgi:hypothetical protein
MKQLITRVPDDVLGACKRRAKAEGVSMNTFVNRLLAQAAEADERGRAIERRIAEAGLTVHLTPHRVPPSDDELRAMLHGSGTAILDELLAERRRN